VQTRAVRVGHIGIAVRDLDSAQEFYTEVVGLRLTERFQYAEQVGHGGEVATAAFLRSDATHHCIVLFERRGAAAGAEGGELGLHHLAFEMATPEHLLDRYRECRRRGVTVVSARRGGPGNQPRFYARDPDANLVEFYWGIDQIGWDSRPRAYVPIQEIDLEAFDFDVYVAEREAAAEQPQA
jgi:catechol 2,3-dioxygenase-like lactoylglutathione lyase family enzyme